MSDVIKDTTVTGSDKRPFDGAEKVFVSCIFIDAALSGAALDDAVFVDCRFERVDLYWALVHGAKFIGCTFQEVDFRGAIMQEVYFFDSVLDKCDFSQDNLGGDTDLSATHFVNSCQRSRKFSATKQA